MPDQDSSNTRAPLTHDEEEERGVDGGRVSSVSMRPGGQWGGTPRRVEMARSSSQRASDSEPSRHGHSGDFGVRRDPNIYCRKVNLIRRWLAEV